MEPLFKKKYEFTGEEMKFKGRTLRRIRYISNFPVDGYILKSGTLGGWIESEENLGHEGNCLVLDEAKVFDNARVYENAIVEDKAIVKDNARVYGQSHVFDNAIVGADTVIKDTSWIFNDSKVFFYENSLKDHSEKGNIIGDSAIYGSSFVEATGTVNDSYVFSKHLYGEVDIINKR